MGTLQSTCTYPTVTRSRYTYFANTISKHAHTDAIRIHTQALGTPIIGDKIHGGIDSSHGMLLASVSITLHHPHTEEVVTFTIDEPKRFAELRDDQQSAWEAKLH